MSVCAIDFSMTCPCICVNEKQTADFNDCKFHYLTNRKKLTIPSQQFFGTLHQKDYPNNECRFDTITNWTIKQIPMGSTVYIENYAFSAKGLVFQIGELTGLLKHKLWKAGFKFVLVEPTKIKKSFTGKGNASKFLMKEAHEKLTGVYLDKILMTPTENPISDIIDSFALYLYGLSR